MGNHRITHPKKRAFLAAYSETGNISQAAKLAGIERRTHYDWLENDHDGLYREAVRDAEQQAADKLEAEARRRAVQGVEEPVYYQGEVVGTVQKYSDTLLIFLLKGARPERYARERIEHTGKDGAPIEHQHRVRLDLTALTDEELDTLDRLVSKVADAGGDQARA